MVPDASTGRAHARGGASAEQVRVRRAAGAINGVIGVRLIRDATLRSSHVELAAERRRGLGVGINAVSDSTLSAKYGAVVASKRSRDHDPHEPPERHGPVPLRERQRRPRELGPRAVGRKRVRTRLRGVRDLWRRDVLAARRPRDHRRRGRGGGILHAACLENGETASIELTNSIARGAPAYLRKGSSSGVANVSLAHSDVQLAGALEAGPGSAPRGNSSTSIRSTRPARCNRSGARPSSTPARPGSPPRTSTCWASCGSWARARTWAPSSSIRRTLPPRLRRPPRARRRRGHAAGAAASAGRPVRRPHRRRPPRRDQAHARRTARPHVHPPLARRRRADPRVACRQARRRPARLVREGAGVATLRVKGRRSVLRRVRRSRISVTAAFTATGRGALRASRRLVLRRKARS